MSFNVGDRVKITNEGRTGVIKDITRSCPIMYTVLRDALFEGEKGRYAVAFEKHLERIDPVQHALNEGFNDYMKAAGYDSKEERNVKYPIGTRVRVKWGKSDDGLTRTGVVKNFTEKVIQKGNIEYLVRLDALYKGEKRRYKWFYSEEILEVVAPSSNNIADDEIKKIIFSGPKTIVFWKDGTKTVVSMNKDEAKFDPEAAFCAAYTKKMFGTNSKIKRVIAEKSNYEDWKEKEEPDDQLYKLGLKALAKCEDIDLKAVESMAKDTEKFSDIMAQMMYEILTGHPYEGEKNNGKN